MAEQSDVPPAQDTAQTADEPKPGTLGESEFFWRDHWSWLQECGYRLRPRYAPDWVPSWEGTSKTFYHCEDGVQIRVGRIMDAIRISDNKRVALKRISKLEHPFEAEIGQFLSSGDLKTDPSNRCIPVYEILQVPDEGDEIIIVMPLLRPYNSPRFDTFGEVVEFVRQIFEGLQFMHHHHVAHRDCDDCNIMLDPTELLPSGYHPVDINKKPDLSGRPKAYTRTQRPTKYYLIDFGISRRYNPEDGPPLEYPIWGGDKTVPEFQKSDEKMDPFPTDVYYLGNLIREDFIQAKLGFQFMEPLVVDMVQDDPTKRPTMDEVVARFATIVSSLSSWKLRSRVVGRKDNAILGAYRTVTHWARRVSYIVRRVPAIPTPKS
ncbi:hypothetical protein JAAARDRAFT_37166 [Jaapia argillacea MUCL 33604]|uniref:non-specific serine/threonine protein kinase n=1 Tax=Jaapia argillacea MUCL 33604 TaxID=933084 RepID=A0A067PZG7_9AGAM|nr:hypothetical protein JAAARDRAFT_37166 [Jaapia argillacea MUCL 33604]